MSDYSNLATVQKILEVRSHPNADRLELVTILGYQSVVPIGKYHAGDLVIFIEPDNCLPKDAPWAQPYLKYAPKRIKAICLRKEWSEGLIIDPEVLTQIQDAPQQLQEGQDLTQLLDITHYEAPVVMVGSNVQGRLGLPYEIPKTDESRFASLRKKVEFGKLVDVTLKIDGQSLSVYYSLKDEHFGVTGRRVEFDYIEDDTGSNNYIEMAKKYELEPKLKQYCLEHNVSLCLRGEAYGQGIQSNKNNPHSQLEKAVAFFSVYNMDEGRYEGPDDPHYFTKVCTSLGLPTVPILEHQVELTPELVLKYQTDLKKIRVGSQSQVFEGVVMKGVGLSFKVINKDYDSKK